MREAPMAMRSRESRDATKRPMGLTGFGRALLVLGMLYVAAELGIRVAFGV